MDKEKLKNVKVCIGVCTSNAVLADAYRNHIVNIAKWAKEVDVFFVSVNDLAIADARNVICEIAREQKCTHLLLIGSTKMLPENLLPVLLSNEDSTIVSGLTAPRHVSAECGKQHGMVASGDGLRSINLPHDGRSYEVDACPMDCTLIRVSILERVDRPYFVDTAHDRGHMKLLYNKRSWLNFCQAVKKLGGVIRIDTRAIVEQLGEPTVMRPDFLDEEAQKAFVNSLKAPADASIGVKGVGTNEA